MASNPTDRESKYGDYFDFEIVRTIQGYDFELGKEVEKRLLALSTRSEYVEKLEAEVKVWRDFKRHACAPQDDKYYDRFMVAKTDALSAAKATDAARLAAESKA